MIRKIFAFSFLIAAIFLAGCGGTPSPAPSAFTGRGGSVNLSQKVGKGATLLMESITKPTRSFHLSYNGQENINPKFLLEAGAKPQIGAVEMQADVTPDELAISSNQGGKKKEAKAKKDDQLGWATSQMELMTPLLDANMELAFGGITAQPAGSDNIGGVTAVKYEMDTSNTSTANKAGLEMASGLLGGKVKIESVKGSVWIDRATGQMVKLNFDAGLSDKDGNSWKEHHEMVVTPR